MESPKPKDLELRWKKTNLMAFASCIKSKLDDHSKHGAQESNGCVKKINKAEVGDDEVFIWDQARRASEPVVLKRNSNALMLRSSRQRPSKLRSLSEDVTVPDNRAPPIKLTRSASSSCATQTALSQFVTFSPRIVRKINLSVSLQDWLEKNPARKNVGENIASNDGCLHQNVQKSNGDECYPYRRRSADVVETKLKIDERRRPSAPPALTGKKNDNWEQNSFEEKPHTPPCYNTDKNLDSIYEFQIHTLIKEELKSKLESVHFCAESCPKWCEEISQVIKERAQGLLDTPCKVVCIIYIGALRDYGIHTASQATLDDKMDYHISACYQNESLFATVSVLVVRYGSG
jgi:hypothetical protein